MKFRNVSIITALNAQKDKINELGSRKFAEETGQELITFYANDSITENSGDTGRKPRNVRQQQTMKVKRTLPPQRQQQLWDAHPCFTSEHIPGKLDICVGLPVMIRNNDATELCITKGQEGRVVGWEEATGNQDQRMLDTLFVELIDPPKAVHVTDLPANVVALTKTSKKIGCTLPDDVSVQITREQVLVLPNFAMTDYASQGKTRAINIVDLNNCQNHFSYYTALSRSSTSAGTIIFQGMNPFKITRGIHGSLRQEFRELEILNEITRLRYEGELTLTVSGWNRRELIRSYRAWKGENFSLGDLHPALQSKTGEDNFVDHGVSTGKWKLVGSDAVNKPAAAKKAKVSPKPGENLALSSAKRNRIATANSAPRKKSKVTVVTTIGLQWDSVNYSCAYDALFTCMYNIWYDHGPSMVR